MPNATSDSRQRRGGRRSQPSTRVHDGTDPEGVIAAVLAEPDVVRIDSRNVSYGCFMFTVTRG